MKIKTSELSGAQLDLAVKRAIKKDGGYFLPSKDYHLISHAYKWSYGGPIIEREGICLKKHTAWPYWLAYIEGNNLAQGPTPLIAAMRCYVTSKLGEEVEVPDELTNQESEAQ